MTATPAPAAPDELAPAEDAIPENARVQEPPAEEAEPVDEVLKSLAVIPGLLAGLPQAIVAGLARVIAQAVAQATPQRLCAGCVLNRVKWENDNRNVIQAAAAQAEGLVRAAVQAGRQPGPGISVEALLPQQVRESMPALNEAVTTAGGTDCCPGHIPGAPGQTRLIIAGGSMSSLGLAARG